MTKKRYRKLVRAYFTRLNEWAKVNTDTTLDMGKCYRVVSSLANPDGMTRAEHWGKFAEMGNTFGVGVKGGI